MSKISYTKPLKARLLSSLLGNQLVTDFLGRQILTLFELDVKSMVKLLKCKKDNGLWWLSFTGLNETYQRQLN